jgi:hypothetical protein
MRLAKVCRVNTVNIGKLDVLVFECRDCPLIVGSKSFAVATPVVKLSQYSRERTMKMYHGPHSAEIIPSTNRTPETMSDTAGEQWTHWYAPSMKILARL